MFNTCKFCEQPNALIKAHLIPKSLHDFERGTLNSVELGDACSPKQEQQGIFDSNILCSKCDNAFGKFDYHAGQAFHKKYRKMEPYKDSNNVSVHYPGLPMFYSVVKADPELVTKFVMSVVYRCHLSDQREAKRFNLGPDADKIKLCLKNNLPLLSHSYRVVLEYNPDFQEIVLVGHSTMDEMNVVTFRAQGFGFHLLLNPHVNSESFNFLQLANGKPVLAISFLLMESKFGEFLKNGLSKNMSKFPPRRN